MASSYFIILCLNRWLPRRWGLSKERARFQFPPSPRAAGVANHRALEFFLKNTRVFSAGRQMQTRSTMRIRRPTL
jgi:hypothetical protein